MFITDFSYGHSIFLCKNKKASFFDQNNAGAEATLPGVFRLNAYPYVTGKVARIERIKVKKYRKNYDKTILTNT